MLCTVTWMPRACSSQGHDRVTKRESVFRDESPTPCPGPRAHRQRDARALRVGGHPDWPPPWIRPDALLRELEPRRLRVAEQILGQARQRLGLARVLGQP